MNTPEPDSASARPALLPRPWRLWALPYFGFYPFFWLAREQPGSGTDEETAGAAGEQGGDRRDPRAA